MESISIKEIEEMFDILGKNIYLPKTTIESKVEVMKENLEKLTLIDFIIDWVSYATDKFGRNECIKNKEDLEVFFKTLTIFIKLLKEEKMGYVAIQYLLGKIDLFTIYESYELENIEVVNDYKVFIAILLGEIDKKIYRKFLLEYFSTFIENMNDFEIDPLMLIESIKVTLENEGVMK